MLINRMKDIAQSSVPYGFWRIYILLRGEGWKDNHKRIYRLYRAEGLNLRSKRTRRCRAAAHRLDRLSLSNLNEVWSMDFVLDQLFDGRRLAPEPFRQHSSPYVAMRNKPINYVDENGGVDGDPNECPNCSGTILDPVTVSAPRMSRMEANAYDRSMRKPDLISMGRFWRPSVDNSHFYKTLWAKDFEKFADAGSMMTTAIIVAPLAGTFTGATIAEGGSLVSAAGVEINAISTYAYIKINGAITVLASSISASIGKHGYEFLKYNPTLQAMRIRNPAVNNLATSFEQAVLDFKLLPARGNPFILRDRPPSWRGTILILWKSTPSH